VTALWPVVHRCGHGVEWDLAKKQPCDRAGFASWLAERDCTRCWWARRRTPHDQNRVVRGRLRQAWWIEIWELSKGMPPLTGGDKAVAWARKVRHRLLTTAANGASRKRTEIRNELELGLEVHARAITTAKWWIDHRKVDPRDLAVIFDRACAEGCPPWSTRRTGR